MITFINLCECIIFNLIRLKTTAYTRILYPEIFGPRTQHFKRIARASTYNTMYYIHYADRVGRYKDFCFCFCPPLYRPSARGAKAGAHCRRLPRLSGNIFGTGSTRRGLAGQGRSKIFYDTTFTETQSSL